MALTPKQVNEELTKDDIRIVQTLEAKIDIELMRGGTAVSIDYPNQRVLRKITQMYQNAGWNVKHESDQREGNYLQFTPRYTMEER